MGLLSGLFSAGNHESPIGAIGGKIQKFTDPMAWAFGDKWVDLTSHKIPEMSNRYLSKVVRPFDKVDQTINPVRRIPAVDRISGIVADKPADAIGVAIGSMFAAPAIGAAMGGGTAGGAGAAGGAQAFPVSMANGTLLSSGGEAAASTPSWLPMAQRGMGLLNMLSQQQQKAQQMQRQQLAQGLDSYISQQQPPQQPGWFPEQRF